MYHRVLLLAALLVAIGCRSTGPTTPARQPRDTDLVFLRDEMVRLQADTDPFRAPVPDKNAPEAQVAAQPVPPPPVMPEGRDDPLRQAVHVLRPIAVD